MRIVLAILSMVTFGVLGVFPTSFADTLIKDARIIDGREGGVDCKLGFGRT
jgi:hypothetical protein